MSAENNTKKRKLDSINTDVKDNKKARAVTPDEAGTARDSDQAKACSHVTPKNSTALTMAVFYNNSRRTPPKGSADISIDDKLKLKSEELLGIKFDKLGTESQLRFMFIVMKEYPKYLKSLFALNSLYRPFFQKDGLSTPKEAMLASLETDTPCGIRLGRLIHKGGDVITETCNRNQLDPCILTYDEFVEQNPVWSNTGTSIFKREAPGGRRVEPFIRMQIENSDLCYLIQGSNATNYHLQKKALRGDGSIDSVRLNNARHIRNVYTPEQSCKHVYVGRGASVEETLLVVLRQGNPGISESCFFHREKTNGFTGLRAAGELYDSLCRHMKSSGPALFDIKSFKEFEARRATTHSGHFSTKTAKDGKHTLLLVDVRKSTKGDTSDEGGYYALFQNTWKNRPIWVEMGFDLLLSMTGTFLFIENDLPFDGDFEAADVREDVLAMSSSPAPIAVCRYANDDPAQKSEEDGLDAENAVVGAAGVERTRVCRHFTFPGHLENFETFAPKPNTFYE